LLHFGNRSRKTLSNVFAKEEIKYEPFICKKIGLRGGWRNQNVLNAWTI